MEAGTRLAVYGTLAPGKANHRQLDGLAGAWEPGWIRGRMARATRGEHTGLPGLIPDPQGEAIPVQVFTSPDLPAHWDRLDRFEGEVFRRVAVRIVLGETEVEAQLYALIP